MNFHKSCTILDMIKTLHEYTLLALCCLNIIVNIVSKVTFQSDHSCFTVALVICA